ncbi:hypothetical protein [Sphingosinicella sp. CPCC 101087]|uniref:hypothetical protein n=1 Tax=Sphingosinicella sp. CPCC 101087 TaxID=2497754 RepID=UPI00101C671A|nr:hypothetical protein [Sphingosinicella sp. CPCC 101087]
MRMPSKIVLVGGLGLAACSPAEQPDPSPATVERFTNGIELRNAEEKSRAVEAADARATGRADEAMRRMADSEQRRAADARR